MKLIKLMTIILAAVWLLVPNAPASAEDAIGSVRVVRVGYFPVDGFMEIDKDTGKFSGYSYEYLLAIAQHTGWQYEFVPVDFIEGLAMLQRGELDLMDNISYTPERAEKLLFSELPSGANFACLKMRTDDMRVAYEDFAAFNDLRVGIRTNSHFTEPLLKYCRDNGCMPQLVYYDNIADFRAALPHGAVDAIVVTSTFNDDGHVIGRFAPEQYYFAVPKNRHDLLNELNRAMSFLKTSDPEFEMRLKQKYYSSMAERHLVLSKSEKAYLAEHGKIRIGYIDNEFPLSYTDEDGNFAGVIAEIFHAMANRTRLNFEYVPITRESEAVHRKVDVVAAVPLDYIWADKGRLNVSKSFADLTIMKVYRNSNDNQVMALPQDKYIASLCRRTYGGRYVYKEYKTTQECLESVRNGFADVTCINSYEYEYYLSQPQYRMLNFQLAKEIEYSLAMGVFKDADYNVYTIMTHALATLSADDLREIFMSETLKIKKVDFSRMLYDNPKMVVFIVLLMGFLIGMVVFCFVYFRMLHDKNTQLANTARIADNANRAKSDFLSRMSHDLRTPMNGVLGTAELARDEVDNPQAMREYLAQIYSSGRFMLELINDILDMSKLENGKFNLKKEPLSRSEFQNDINAVIKPLLNEKDIEFVMDIGGNVEYIMTDRLRYKQIFFNLLSNAAKFTPPGGRVELTSRVIGRKDKRVGIRAVVRDTGIGMTKDFIAHMYEPFAQELRSDLNERQGTGLGLAIVKSIVQTMGGSITVKSELGEGTEFIIELWVEECTGEQRPQEAPQVEIDLHGRRLLLVDDHPINLKIAEKLLQRKGATVDKAENGQLAVDKFSAGGEGYYDAVLMDIRMPVLNGLEAARQIRSLNRADAAKVPIIAMTANVYAEEIRQTKQAGMNKCIAKPLEPQKLYEILVRLLPGAERD